MMHSNTLVTIYIAVNMCNYTCIYYTYYLKIVSRVILVDPSYNIGIYDKYYCCGNKNAKSITGLS